MAWVAAALALAPAVSIGFLRDDWFLLWAHVDAATAPEGALGVFPRPVARLYWWLVSISQAPYPAHLFSIAIALFGLLGLWRLCRTQPRLAEGAPWALLFFGLHTSLLELRMWAAASNGLIACTLSIWGLLHWQRDRRALAAAFVFAAVLARMDAVLVVLLCLGSLPRVAFRRWFFALAAGVLALVLVLRLAGQDPVVDWGGAARAARLLVLPWGGGLPAPLAGGLGALVVVAASWGMWRWPHERSALLVVLAVCGACALLPWNVAGRYLAMGVLATALVVAAHPPRAIWTRAAIGIWLAAHLASDVAGNTLRDLRARSRAETRLYVAASRLALDCSQPLLLADVPPMGWSDSEADAENVVSFAWRCDARVQFVDAAARPDALRYDGTRWVSLQR